MRPARIGDRLLCNPKHLLTSNLCAGRGYLHCYESVPVAQDPADLSGVSKPDDFGRG